LFSPKPFRRHPTYQRVQTSSIFARLGHGMMSGMGLVWILGIGLLILGIAAAIKYLHSPAADTNA
jgi:hypothetical protein